MLKPIIAVALLLTGLAFILACSDSSAPPPVAQEVSFAPNSGPPGTVITITGVDLRGRDAAALSVSIGSQPAPAVVDAAGHVITGIPLFLDGAGTSHPPADPVDLVLYEEDAVVYQASGAVTVTALVDAPGTTAAVAARLTAIGASLAAVTGLLAATPGVQAQHAQALVDALDGLLNGDGEHTLATNLALLQGDAEALRTVDAVLAHTGVLDAMTGYATFFASAANDLQAAASAKAIGTTDVALAKQMQFYVILADFAQEVVAKSAAEIGAVTGLIGIASSHPYLTVVSLVTNYVNFIVNKIAVGLFPSTLDGIDLAVEDTTLDHGATTNSTITLHASNTPPEVSVLDLTEQVLVGLGLAASPSTETFRDILLQTSQYFLGLMSSTIQAYAQLHPELDLDPTLFALVPAMTWTADAVDPVLLDCGTFTPGLVTRVDGDLQWLASATGKGRGRIYVRPTTDPAARYFTSVLGYEYNAGSFGENMTQSPTVSVFVGLGLVVWLDFPTVVEAHSSTPLGVRCGYEQADGTIDYRSGIEIAVEVAGGTATAVQGVTDGNGMFATTVQHDGEAQVISIAVSAIGEDGIDGGDTRRTTVEFQCRGILGMTVDVFFDYNNNWTVVMPCDPEPRIRYAELTWLNSWAAGLTQQIGYSTTDTIREITGIPQGHSGDLIMEIRGSAMYDYRCDGPTLACDTVTVYIPPPTQPAR